LDAEIQRRWFAVNEMAAQQAVSPLRQRLVELKSNRSVTALTEVEPVAG
jgi:hypothetical protein